MRNINKNCLLIVRLVETVKQKLSSSLNQISEQICPFKKSTTAGQQHFTETRYGLFYRVRVIYFIEEMRREVPNKSISSSPTQETDR